MAHALSSPVGKFRLTIVIRLILIFWCCIAAYSLNLIKTEAPAPRKATPALTPRFGFNNIRTNVRNTNYLFRNQIPKSVLIAKATLDSNRLSPVTKRALILAS
jgi:hypothetical protein